MNTRNGNRAIAVCLATLIAAVSSCAVFGPPRVKAPCDERFETLLPAMIPTGGLEIVGKIRIEFPPYRVRGLVRIAYSPVEGAARIDFRQSSLFGAMEEDATVLVGDSLAVYDRGSGRWFGNDSSLALIERGTGWRIAAADILDALLFTLPRCAELGSAEIEYSGADWVLRGIRRDRRIEMRGERAGVREFRQCFSGERDCFVVKYGPSRTSARVRYPAWIRLSRENGKERITLECTDIKEGAPSTPILGGERSSGR